MARYVMKFGGTSTADPDKLRICAKLVAQQARAGHQIVVVVSAPAGMTDDLSARIREVDPDHQHQDEADVILSAGEQINAGLMVMCLRDLGLSARSWMGWQAGLITEVDHGQARLTEARTEPLSASLDTGEIAVLAGFQGMTAKARITTLGRGGSDVTAVAVASAVQAQRCDIYTDVTGVFTADPRIVPEATRISSISAPEMLEMASNGAKVLHSRSVELALAKRIPLRVLSTFTPGCGTAVVPETDPEKLETHLVSGITYSRDESRISLYGLQAGPAIASLLFSALSKQKINVDMLVQNPSRAKTLKTLVFATSRRDHQSAKHLLQQPRFAEYYETMETKSATAKVSVIGLGLRSQTGMAHLFFEALAKADIVMDAVATSELRISALIAEDQIEQAVQALHFAYDLDRRTP